MRLLAHSTRGRQPGTVRDYLAQNALVSRDASSYRNSLSNCGPEPWLTEDQVRTQVGNRGLRGLTNVDA